MLVYSGPSLSNINNSIQLKKNPFPVLITVQCLLPAPPPPFFSTNYRNKITIALSLTKNTSQAPPPPKELQLC